jgi:hypothetical protein
MNKMIALVMSVSFVVIACGGSKPKKEEPLIEGEQANESCCCRIETDNPDDPTFTLVRVMECSSRHGACIKSGTQCEGQPEPSDEPVPDDSGPLPPTVEDTPTSF